ncbi:lamin-C-like [Drosophila eugracilis]|uniref:lamin-C-like n=1 Tax=Drosophila eugracilis TaxID=29029 RepID=UPI001BDAD0C1|nr:lamin-C-like [Drosophila eugracilis]
MLKQCSCQPPTFSFVADQETSFPAERYLIPPRKFITSRLASQLQLYRRSSTCYSRVTEEVELQNLNDRLAIYFDRVRNLEIENSRLSIEVQTTRDTVTHETSNIKNIWMLRPGIMPAARSLASGVLHDFELVRELEQKLDNTRERLDQEVAQLEKELIRLSEEMTYQPQEYQDIAVSLDLEIVAYDKDYYVAASVQGNVENKEIDAAGKFVKYKGNYEVAIRVTLQRMRYWQLYFFLWAYLKSNVYACNPQILDELKDSIRAEMRAIPTDML